MHTTDDVEIQFERYKIVDARTTAHLYNVCIKFKK